MHTWQLVDSERDLQMREVRRFGGAGGLFFTQWRMRQDVLRGFRINSAQFGGADDLFMSRCAKLKSYIN